MESIMAKQVLMPIQLYNGVVSHAAARRLYKAGYMLDQEGLRQEADISREMDAGLGARLDELSRRIESQEKAHAEAVSSLLDTQERLVAQIESLVHRLLDEETGGEELRASA